MYMYVYIYIYIYICNHENNVPSRLSPQWLCGNSCTWANIYIKNKTFIIRSYISVSSKPLKVWKTPKYNS